MGRDVIYLAHDRRPPWSNPSIAVPAGAEESCGIAAGLFIAAVHHMGLVTLTHTPNHMTFLRELLGRPANERAMLVMPVGYPAPGARVPDLSRKSLEEISDWR